MGPNASGFDPMSAIAFGWNAVMKDFAAIALPIVVAMLVMIVPTLILSVISGVVTGALGSRLDPLVLRLFTVIVQCVTQVVTLASQAFVFGGLVQFTLGVCRGQRPAFNVVFSGGRFFLPMLGGQLLYTLGVAAGLMLCLVPGFILACGWVCYQPFIVDKGLGPIDALKASWGVTKGQKGGIFLYLLLSGAVGLLGVLALCVGAILVAWPVLAIANAFVYLRLTGEEPRALA